MSHGVCYNVCIMKRTEYPAVTILVVTLNNERTIDTCLKAIQNQEYPKKQIEYLNIDGGSTDGTVAILTRYGFKSMRSPILHNAEAQRGVGLKRAKHNLIVSLDADNYLPHKKWLRQMVEPFMEDSKIIHAHTLHYTYRPTDTLFNRYCALFGVADPIVFYVGRPDRLPQYVKSWISGNILKKSESYSIVEFNKDTLPTVGCNGVVYRRDLLLKHAKSDPAHFLHIDVFADLLDKGYNRYAIVNNNVIHDTAVSLSALMKKRIAFLTSYYLKQSVSRRYLIYDPSKPIDRFKLMLFVFYTITWIKPLFDGIVGFMVIPDIAWFLNPIVCWMYLYAYGIASIKRKFFSKNYE